MIKFEDDYNSFEEKLKTIKDELLININTNKSVSNITNFDNRIKDLEKQYLTIKNVLRIYKEKNDNEDYFEKFYRNKSSRGTSKNIFNNLSRNEGNSFFERIEKREMKKSEINKDKSEFELLLSSTISHKNDNQIIEEKKDIFSKTKNILNNRELLKNHRFSRNSYKSQKNKFNNSSSRVISGKIFNHFPFISYIQNNKKENTNNILNIKREKFLNIEKNDSKENICKNKELRDLKNKKEKESKEKNSTKSFHNNIYLDKKIDILGKSMVNNYNKIINQINFLKENFINNEIRKTIKLKDNKGNNNSIIFS